MLSGPIKQDPARPEYHRVHLAWQGPVGHGAQECMAPESCGHFVATSTGGQASSRLASAATATGLVEVPRGDRILPTGTVVNVLLVSDARSM